LPVVNGQASSHCNICWFLNNSIESKNDILTSNTKSPARLNHSLPLPRNQDKINFLLIRLDSGLHY
jgi:hypothetical protein